MSDRRSDLINRFPLLYKLRYLLQMILMCIVGVFVMSNFGDQIFDLPALIVLPIVVAWVITIPYLFIKDLSVNRMRN